MFCWARTFLFVALVAALFGFGGIASASSEVARILFFIFITLSAVTMMAWLLRGRTPVARSGMTARGRPGR